MLTRWLLMTFGDADEHYAQAHLAVLGLIAHAPEPREIYVATDHPERFAWLARASAVRVTRLDAEKLKTWKGQSGFFWRVKLECIRQHLVPGVALVYVDSDTIARRDLSPMVAALAKGALMMHEAEHTLATSPRRGDRELWKLVGGKTFAGLAVTDRSTMWNAGVVAVGPDGAYPVLERALNACDELCTAIGNHSLNEQFALSMAMSATGRITPAQPWIDHYWGNKPDWLRAIGALTARVLAQDISPVAAAAWVRDHPIELPVHVRRPWWKKRIAQALDIR